MLDPTYPVNPVGSDGKPISQVIAPWHQGDNDQAHQCSFAVPRSHRS